MKCKILDCTFRDGGYLNNWRWNLDIVKENLDVLEEYVDIIELGYRSPSNSTKYKDSGEFRFCREEYLQSICEVVTSEDKLCVMIDLCDYFDSTGKFDLNLLCNNFVSKDLSVFTYVRVAIQIHQLEEAEKAVWALFTLGYSVMLSVMKVSILSEEEISSFIDICRHLPISHMYFADSFGGILSNKFFSHIEDNCDGESKTIGFHAHNNCDLALSNSIKHSILPVSNSCVDTTILGIGRGAGNCDLCSYLLYSCNDIDSIVKLINTYWVGIKKDYTWGYDLCYMLCGINGIHPKYYIELKNRSVSEEMSIKAIRYIASNNSNKEKCSFNNNVLESAIKGV